MAKLCRFEEGTVYVGQVIKTTEPSDPILNKRHPPILRLCFRVYEIRNRLVYKGCATALLVLRGNCSVCKAMEIDPKKANEVTSLLLGRWFKLGFEGRIESQRQRVRVIGPIHPKASMSIIDPQPVSLKIGDLSRLLAIGASTARRLFDKVEGQDPLATHRVGRRGDRLALFPRFALALARIEPELAALVPAELRP